MIDGRIFGHLFWKVETYTSLPAASIHICNAQGGGDRTGKLGKFGNFKFQSGWQVVLGAVLDLIFLAAILSCY